jgi:hypothetical protein
METLLFWSIVRTLTPLHDWIRLAVRETAAEPLKSKKKDK